MQLELELRKECINMDRSASNSVGNLQGRSSSLSCLNESNASEEDHKRKHRRGKKKARPKWKPYSKMTVEERKALEKWEDSRTASKVADIAARSRRPIAPFNTTQFLMDDRQESQIKLPPSSSLARSVSYDSSLSGDDAHFEPEDEDYDEQDAFLEADFNQVYAQLRTEKLEQMSKKDLIEQYFIIEDTLSDVEKERTRLTNELEQMTQQVKALSEENSRLKTMNNGGHLDIDNLTT